MDIHWRHNQSILENFDRETSQRDLLSVTLRVMSGRYTSTVGKLHTRAITFAQAKELIEDWHNHLSPPAGWKFGLALQDDVGIVGVTTVGRPVARKLDDGATLEITRCALMDKGIKNAASMMIGAACKSGKSMGDSRMISYTLDDEDGVAYKAAGFHNDQTSKGGRWSRSSRDRKDNHPTCPKRRWVKYL